MIKDFRYIIKRVIIGVLICVAISCINSCKVKALDLDDYIVSFSYLDNTYVDLEKPFACASKDYYIINYNTPSDNLSNPTDNFGIPNALSSPSGSTAFKLICFNSSDLGSNGSYDGSTNTLYFVGSDPFNNNTGGKIYNLKYNNQPELSLNLLGIDYRNFNIRVGNATLFYPYNQQNRFFKDAGDILFHSSNNQNFYLLYGSVLSSNVNIKRCSSGQISTCNSNVINDIWDTSLVDSVPPSIIDIEYIPYVVNNILTEVSLFPEFSDFDTDNYIYEYGFTIDNDIPDVWLSLEQNSQWLRFRNNGTLFVRIKDKQTNEIIDSSTFTIDNMGKPVEDEDAYIDITSEYRTENYLAHKTKKGSMSLIVENQLYLDYNPKSSFYRYFYQYIPVENGVFATTPNDNNWEELAESNNGSRTYVVSQNGVLFAKMEDIDGNVVATANYKVDNIGILATDNPDEKSKAAWYYRIGKKLNFGGPIGSLINIPISLISSLYSGISNSNSCSMYSLGTLWGTPLNLPCVNLRTYLGSLYNVIDLILSGVMIYFLAKMIMRTYNNFLSLNKDPVNIEKGGDS